LNGYFIDRAEIDKVAIDSARIGCEAWLLSI
jgi:hypothetical protein